MIRITHHTHNINNENLPGAGFSSFSGPGYTLKKEEVSDLSIQRGGILRIEWYVK